MERLEKYWLAGICKKSENRKRESSVPLEILNFTSAFILLASGMVLVGCLLAVEHIYFKFFRRRLRKWDQQGCCSLVSLSVGKSLTFEHTVREAMELHKNYKCTNPICETLVWKLRHELDMAQLNVQRLERQIKRNRYSPNEGQRSLSENGPSSQKQCQRIKSGSCDRILAIEWHVKDGESRDRSSSLRNIGSQSFDCTSRDNQQSIGACQHIIIDMPAFTDSLTRESLPVSTGHWSRSDSENNLNEYSNRCDNLTAPPTGLGYPPSYTNTCVPSDDSYGEPSNDTSHGRVTSVCQSTLNNSSENNLMYRNMPHQDNGSTNLSGFNRHRNTSEIETAL